MTAGVARRACRPRSGTRRRRARRAGLRPEVVRGARERGRPGRGSSAPRGCRLPPPRRGMREPGRACCRSVPGGAATPAPGWAECCRRRPGSALRELERLRVLERRIALGVLLGGRLSRALRALVGAGAALVFRAALERDG